jgi:predicted nuclease with TOPRIM domain
MDNIYTLVITLLSVLTGTTAWRYLEKRAMKKERDDEFIRVDCKERIAKLEALLIESSREKDEMRDLILKLTSEVAELRIKVEFLTHENDLLHTKTKKHLNG